MAYYSQNIEELWKKILFWVHSIFSLFYAWIFLLTLRSSEQKSEHIIYEMQLKNLNIKEKAFL